MNLIIQMLTDNSFIVIKILRAKIEAAELSEENTHWWDLVNWWAALLKTILYCVGIL